MNVSKNDRRVMKTRKAINDAFAELLAEKELRKITVQEIADKADINRVTFYKHYLDVYDLYEKAEKEILVDLGLLILDLEALPSKEVFAHLTEHILNNRVTFRMIFSPNNTSGLKDKFSRMMEGLFYKMQSEAVPAGKHVSETVLMYQSCYRAQGCLALISKWVLRDFSEPREKIAEAISGLDRNTAEYMSRNA